MFEVLAAHLDVLVPPEQKALIINACDALVLMGVTRHDVILDNELSVVDSIGNDVVLNMVDNTLIPLYRQTLGEFGIILEDEVHLRYLTDIMVGLTRIENWADQQSIADLCTSDEDADAVLSDLLEMVGQYSSADYHSQFQSVKPELIDRIAQTCEPQQYSELQIDPGIAALATQRVAHYRLAFSNPDSGFDIGRWLLEQIADEGLRPGTPMAYLSAAHPLPNWESWKLDDQAAAVLGQVMASSTPAQQEIEVACLYAEPYIHTPAEMIAFRHALTRAYNRYLAIGAAHG